LKFLSSFQVERLKWAGGWGESGVAGWRLKPARKGGSQRSANQGKAFPFYKKTSA